MVVFFQPQYLEDILGYSAAEAGLLILPVMLPMVVISLVASRFVDRFGARLVMGGGMLLGVGGLLLMHGIDAGDDYGDVFWGYLLFGIALGCVYAPMQTAAMAAMPDAKAGIASGVLAMNRVMSGALSLAITASIFHTLLREQIESKAGAALGERAAGELEGLSNGTPSATAELARQPAERADAISTAVDEAFTYALSNTMLFPLALTVVCTVLTWIYVRSPDPPGSEGKPPPHHHHRGRFHL